MDETVDLKKLAEILGLSQRRLQQLAKQNIVIKAKRGLYFLSRSVQGYIQYLRDDMLTKDEEGNQLVDHKLRLTAAKADTEEMKAARMRNELVSTRDVQVAWSEIGNTTRMRIRAVPNEVILRVRAAQSDAEAKEVMQKALDVALREIEEAEITIKARDSGGPEMDSSPLDPDE